MTIPKAFLLRRLHSLSGLWLAVYLIIHLFTNSQAALVFGDDGIGFIRAVNSIHELPYLPMIEISILAIPILIHVIWGIEYARSAKYNFFGHTGHTPYLPKNPRNRAYTWQRITSWLLVFGILAHVIHMRFIESPLSFDQGTEHHYMVRISADEGLYTLAPRLRATIYNQEQLNQLKIPIKALEKRPLLKGEVIASADNFGTVELLLVRDTFKMPIMLVLYTLFVLTACFHAFNGLWTAMITWGITLSARSQRLMRYFSNTVMCIVAGLGLSAIWLTYFVNLKH